MGDDLTGILDECLDRLQAGESQADCLAAYPAYATELSPMLAAAARVTTGLQAAQLSSAQRSRAKSALRQAAAHSERRGVKLWAPVSLWGRLAPARLGGLAWAAIVAGFVLLTGTSTAIAASQPGDLAYGVRVLAERVPALVQTDPQARADAELGLAERRLADVRGQLTREGRVDSRALAALLAADETAVQRAAELAAEARAPIMAAVAEHARTLNELSLTAPASTQAALTQAAEQAGIAGREAGPAGPGNEGLGTPVAANTSTPVEASRDPMHGRQANATIDPAGSGPGSDPGAAPAVESRAAITATNPGKAPKVPPGQARLTEPARRRGNPPPGRGERETTTAEAEDGADAPPYIIPGQTPKPDRTPPGLERKDTPKPPHPGQGNPGGTKDKPVPPGKQTDTPTPHP